MKFSVGFLLLTICQIVFSNNSNNNLNGGGGGGGGPGGGGGGGGNGGNANLNNGFNHDDIDNINSNSNNFMLNSDNLNSDNGGNFNNPLNQQLNSNNLIVNGNNTITHQTAFDTKLNHLVVDRTTGRVFIGGINRVHQLSPDLDVVQTVITGPQNDSYNCTVYDCPIDTVKTLTNNVNKVLLIDYNTRRLISCGSLFQGICIVRNLQNVSVVEQEVQEAIVANNENASTVAFIAPGPPSPPVTNVMYVGVTFTANSPYRSEIPAVSSRSLDKSKMFQIASSAVTTGTRMFINNYARDNFLVHYVYGFNSERFSYFLTTQLKYNAQTQPREYISKLVRVCQEDSNYYSYTEIPIDCISEAQGGTKYNLVSAAYLGKPGAELAENLLITPQEDVLYAVFSEGKGDKPTNKSALCVYTLKAIRRKFMQNIKLCFNGNGQRGLDFISPNMKCVTTKLQTISEDFCGLDVNSPLGGEHPMASVPVLLFNSYLTAVAATRTSGYTVVFIGTADGHLKKVVVESGSSAIEYSDIVIDRNSAVNSDMHFDTQDLNLYVMTEQKISKVKVYDCTVYKTCGECLGAKDPYCGWCSLENKCSLRSNCQDDTNDPLFWVSYKSGKCTTITSVMPHQLQRTTARTLELFIDHLPALKDQLVCAFATAEKPTIYTNATRKRNGVNCTTPRTDLLPQIAPGKHHFTAKLSVRTENGPDLVSTDFTFFDCNTHLSCTRCVSSQFPCDWCVEAHRCTHDTAENCRNDILVTGVSRIGPSYRSGPGFCPTINATGDGSELLVAAGAKKSIKVKVHIIGQFIVQTRFVCQFNIEGRVTSVNAQLLGDTIYCEPMEFIYTSKSPNLTATFAVIWGGSKPLDNPHNIHVVIYRCRDMCDSCGTCLALPDKYNCGWCQSTATCEVDDQCSKQDEKKIDWLNRLQTCPNPKIHTFEPKTGPWEGGTNITIRGINLGKMFSDIYSGVKVAGIYCEPYKDLYIDTKEIVCKVDGPGVEQYRQGRIVVHISDYRGESATDYQFVDPKIDDFKPKFGPKSGGTQVTITGQHLNAGSRIRAYIDEQPCEILSADETQALCRTSPVRPDWLANETLNGKIQQQQQQQQQQQLQLSGTQQQQQQQSNQNPNQQQQQIRHGKLKMTFDNGVREFNGDQFRYVDDPYIEFAASGPLGQIKTPKGIPAGGIRITVVGNQFESIQKPQMYIYYQNKMFLSLCEINSNVEMICDSPIVDTDGNDVLDPDRPLQLEYGFQMDDVVGVQNLSIRTQIPFELYPNPVYLPFEENVKYFKSEYLTINGKNLDRACRESDVMVMIGGDAICNITSLSRQQLTCRPPTEATDSNETPIVKVKIGHTLMYEIGVLSYASPNIMHGLTRPALFSVIAGIIILLFVFIGLLIAYRKKTSESNRVLKNMQEQMDILELQVAAECKEAFAELQTEMGDLTGDLTSGGIPFLDYRTYAMKILFPNNDDHIVLQWERPELLRKDKGLRLFGQLIMNKTFLLLFIRTLESNRYFSMRERVNVASLIMVTLQSKLEYCTDILKTLLAELIEKCIDGKSHPKLLLRRTESVAEKMLSAWFTFLLYKFLKECAGEPLYMLFRAVKGQVDKGPVDAITHEARYSLSEEKLIRQLIEFKLLTVYVSITQQPIFVNNSEMLPTNTENVPVKVLDCDTIGQLKEKCLDTIYRNTPSSQRPKRDDLDVEWRTGSTGRVLLYDEDTTTKFESEWKKLNTLQHYHVPDGACLTLVPRQSSIYNFSILSDKNDKSHHHHHQHHHHNQHHHNQHHHKYETLNLSSGKYHGGTGQNTTQSTGQNTSTTSPPFSRAGSPLNNMENADANGMKWWHLVKHHDIDLQKEGERVNKMVSEIYLTRLLATKGTLQKFVDDLFETIFSTAHRGSALPLAIKYMFDFLDDQALLHGITDPEVVHTWKSNSLPLRFWVNLIKNPNFVFDIHKSNIVDSCLSVVAQTFMDSCSTSDHRLGKDSPSSKLLYAKDIPSYRGWVERYYSDIRDMPAISDQDMNAMLAEESRLHTTEFNTNCALHELYTYAVKYNEQLTVTLEEDEFSQKQRLAYKLEQVHNIMSSE